MKRSVKIALIVAAGFVATGLMIVFASLVIVEFDFSRFDSEKYSDIDFEINEEFHSIDIKDADYDIILVSTTSENTRVRCVDSKNVFHSVGVKDGVLRITRIDSRPWIDFISFGWIPNLTVTVFLPEGQYEDIDINTASGDISVPSGFTFEQAKLTSASGRIDFSSSAETVKLTAASGDISSENITGKELTAETLSGSIHLSHITSDDISAKTTSGDIILNELSAEDDLNLKSVSGSIELESADAKAFIADTTSGDIELDSVAASAHTELTTTSGEIIIDNCDSDTFYIKAVSGDIEGTLLTPKAFIVETVSGDIRIPSDAYDSSAGTCEIKTTSGNIRLSVSR